MRRGAAEGRRRRRAKRPGIPAGRGSRAPAAVPLGRRAAHRAASALAHRVHRLPAGAQLRRPTAAGGGFGRRAGRGAGINPDAQIIVVVCREGNRHVGIAVSHVLDVAAGGDLFEAGTSQRTGGVTLLKDPRDRRGRPGRRVPPAGRKARPPSGTRLRRQWHEHSSSFASQRKVAALVEMCSVRVGQTLFGVPITHILEIVGRRGRSRFRWRRLCRRPGPLSRRRADHGEPAPVAGLPPKEGPQDILVLESAGGCFGLLVDSVGEVLTVSSADHEPNPSILGRAPQSLVCRRLQAQGQPAGHARSRAAGPHAPEREPGGLGSTGPACAQSGGDHASTDCRRFPLCQGLLRGLLEEKGIECEEAADGQAGMDQLNWRSPFDLALVDWNMPVMNGLEMLKQCAPRDSAASRS
jgi:chemotaxis signal transduction protein